MANTLKFKRGLLAGIPTAALGEPLFTTDTFDLYIGNGTGNTRFQKYIASGTTSQLLRGDGSLLTMPIVLTSPSNGQVLKYNGTSWVNDSDAGITGSGTTNYLPKFMSATTLGNSLVYDNGSFVGINSTTNYNVQGAGQLTLTMYSTSGAAIELVRNTSNDLFGAGEISWVNTHNSAGNQGIAAIQVLNDGTTTNKGGIMQFLTKGNGASGVYTERMRITSGGNLLVGTSTNNGLRFQVTGDGYFSNAVGIGTTTSAGTELIVRGTTSGYDKNIVVWERATDGAVRGALGFGKTAGVNENNIYIGSITNHSLLFQTNNLERARIDASGNLGVGVTPTQRLHVAGNSLIVGGATWTTGTVATQFFGDIYGSIKYDYNTTNFTINSYGLFSIATNGTSPTTKLTVFANGNTAIGSTSDNGLRFQVTGDGYFSGSVGIGSASPTVASLMLAKTIAGTGGAFGYGILQEGVIQSNVTSFSMGFYNLLQTQAASFTLNNYYHYFAQQATLGAGSAISNQYGYFVQNTLTGATNNFGFYGDIASGTGRWNLYMNGTAANYLNGGLLIGTTTYSMKLTVLDSGATYVAQFRGSASSFITVGDTSLAGESGVNLRNSSGQGFLSLNGTVFGMTATSGANTLTFSTLGNERARIDSSGNLGLGVTPSAWYTPSSGIAMQMTAGSLYSLSTNSFYLNQNAFLNASASWRYIATNPASQYLQNAGNHYWNIAPSGTAGNAITWSQAMTLFSTGNFAIGTTTDAGFKLDVNGTMRVSGGGVLHTAKFEHTSNDGGINVRNNAAIATNRSAQLRLMLGTTEFGASDVTYQLVNIGTSASAGDFLLQYYNGSTYTERFRIASTGAATFSSSVTAGGITSNAFTRVNLNGSDTLGAGAFNALYNTAFTTAILQQLNASNGLDWWSLASSTWTKRMTLTADGNLGIAMTPSYKLDVTGQARISDAIAIGTTPDTNLPFKILKNINSTVGVRFENTSTGASAFSAIQFGTDVTGGTKFTNIVYGSSGIAQSGVYYPDGTSMINKGTGGLNFYSEGAPIRLFNGGGNGVLKWELVNDAFVNHYSGTAPSASVTDGYSQYSADITAGNAAPHFRTENGGIIKLYQQTTAVTSATYIGGAGTGLTDSDTYDGYTIAQIVKALRNAGLLA